ncbi:MAG TPA: alpha-ketoglutaric semialdehyde dehydrogenase GucD [Candidatus Bathyarchaeia archaeon]|nr:alpha-ketoglutaric semialdehyde dehydrogenase GucD [Candidatus Bathyarchaeia archaeon]
MTTTYKNYCNGEWKEAASGETISIMNPANRHEVVGNVQSSTFEDVNHAVLSAKKALQTWKSISSTQRGTYLQKAADILENRLDEIAVIATREMGKTLAETRGEVLRAASILRYYAQEGMRKVGDVIPSTDSKNLLYTTRVPLGVVAVISPWNFPIAIPTWKIAPALIFGNTVVFKPALETSITGIKLVEALVDAGIPAGVVNLVTGKGSVVGNDLVSHPDVNGITFTGSNEVGKRIGLSAVARGVKFQLEMGGKNPAIILEDADLEKAAELVVNGAMKHTGQKCTATSRVFIQRSVYDKCKEMILKKIQAITIGSGLDEGVYMGPLASKSQYETVLSFIEKGIQDGATLLYGGNVPGGKNLENGYFLEPTVFENVGIDTPLAQEEIFGPVLCLFTFESMEEAIELANNSRFGLSASLFTKDLAKAMYFVSEIDAGLIKVNGESAGVELQAPFGGMKQSSSHSREQGQSAVEFFTSIKTVTITPSLG